MKLKGKAHVYGQDVNTDLILPGRYLNITTAEELGKHCMEDFDKEFCARVKLGDIIVARKNYGCGSSREHAPVAIKANGVSCVIADSFARIFYRNSLNIALPLIECPELSAITEAGDEIEVDLEAGVAANLTKGKKFDFPKYPEAMTNIINAGGLVEYTRKTL
jgi:3-isopropylmalate/(R)-2-methylmalate dehydratase small subunit